MGTLFAAFRGTKKGQSVLTPAVFQVPLIQNNQYSKVAYLRVTYPKLLQWLEVSQTYKSRGVLLSLPLFLPLSLSSISMPCYSPGSQTKTFLSLLQASTHSINIQMSKTIHCGKCVHLLAWELLCFTFSSLMSLGLHICCGVQRVSHLSINESRSEVKRTGVNENLTANPDKMNNADG